MTNLWNEIHLVSSVSTRPDVITSSAKSFGRIPMSSCRSKSMPDFCRSSTDSGANMSSLEQRQSVSRKLPRGGAYALDAKVKVKLPCRNILRVVTVLVGEGESNLDDFEQVHVTSHGLVVVVGGSLKRAYWTRNDSRKFSVLGEAW